MTTLAQTISTYYAALVLLSITAYFLYELDLMYTREYEEEYRNH